MSLTAPPARWRFDIRGQVQGVGFRPYVYRLAAARALHGYVANNGNGAIIEVEGPPDRLAEFAHALTNELPPLARITELARRELPPQHATGFRIVDSEHAAGQRPEVTPDAAVCADCLRELFDPGDRRYRYPFINCTNCGPRYSIIRSVPYDRPQTTMAVFTMCAQCAAEYADPGNRRFHAQPNACPQCGPRLRLVSARGADLDGDPVRAAAELLAVGRIVAVKGIGGYHLACRADREDVVVRLRTRKLRDGKPLALLAPSLAAAQQLCELTPADVAVLTAPAAPIVLAPQLPGHAIAPAVASGCADFGVLLPYAPLHHLLFAEGLGPLVLTSANVSGQPLTFRDADALRELADVADAFLVHDREIFRPIDDSVVFTFRGSTAPIRRARGYAPQPLRLGPAVPARHARMLAVGGELKSAVCLLDGDEAILSEHLGDLGHPDACRHFVFAIERLAELCGFAPEVVACDLHPQYFATGYARRRGLPVIAVQHHHAHIASVMAEHGVRGPLLGLACDGTGYGSDGAIWGGELLRCAAGQFTRLGHLEYFPLVGGDLAAVETWRPAAALLRDACGARWREALLAGDTAAEYLPSSAELELFEQQAARGLNAPRSSSLGRVFDAASFLLGLCARNRHEAEAALVLEAAARRAPPGPAGAPVPAPLTYALRAADGVLRLDFRPTIRQLLDARGQGESVAWLAACFHETVAAALADMVAQAPGGARGEPVALSGGCFANRVLLRRVVELLEGQGRRVLYHQGVPSGDGGLALGQALVAAWQTEV